MNDDDLVEVNQWGFQYKQSIGKHWQRLLEEEAEEQIARVAEQHHWIIALHGIDLPQQAKDHFWKHYAEVEADKNRYKALHGVAALNYLNERNLLNSAAWEHDQRQLAIGEEGTEESQKMSWNSMAVLGIQFAEMVAKRDDKAFERMAAIIKAGKTPVSTKPKGGKDSAAGKMLREFIRLHLDSRGLPTKKELRESCGYSSSIEDMKAAGETMKYLGLAGLPEASGRK